MTIRMLKGIFAQRKHEARTRALRMSSWLGLDSPQAASLESFLLDNGADGVLALPSDLELWVKANLRPEQAEAYARYQESCRRTEAEANALAELHRISQAMEVKEEQRGAIFERAFEIHLLSAEAASSQEFFQRDKPRQLNEPSWIGVLRGFTDGLYRSVMTKDQADAYSAYLSKQQELEERLEEEAE